MRDWWQTVPHKSNQINELLVKPDLRRLSAARMQHDSCILVGAHVGPTVAGLGIFQMENRPFKTFGSADRDRADGATLIPLTSKSIASMRALVNNVTGGTTIGLLGDEPLARDSFLVDFLGREIELPPYVPRLIQTYKLPSFWCCPLWRSGRIVVKLERLPDPNDGEARSQWSQRWFGAYLNKLERVMRGRPENLGLSSGVWANVNSAVIRDRRRQVAQTNRRTQTFTFVAATSERGAANV